MWREPKKNVLVQNFIVPDFVENKKHRVGCLNFERFSLKISINSVMPLTQPKCEYLGILERFFSV
jgi:hypothetical protein